MTELQAWVMTPGIYAGQDPAYLRAADKLQKAYQRLGGGNRWGEARRFAGRSAGSRLDAVSKAKAQKDLAWDRAGKRHRKIVLAAYKKKSPIPPEVKDAYPDLFPKE